ncbi:hypothetical protein HYS91_01220 [Candidatus Daviesbacteria bacterium]|nr:hypothetical protein [Candidatus Daviesbacteria bacterium]
MKVRIKVSFIPLLITFLFFLLIITSGFYLIANKNLISTNLLEQKSKASIYTNGNNLKIDFKISNKDMSKAVDFSNRLKIGTSWVEGIEIDLDSESIQKLNQHLPLEVALDFQNKGLAFKSNSRSILNSGLPGESFELASNSGKLSFKSQAGGDYAISVKNPTALIQHATESGKLFISKKLDGLFPILNKVDTISIDVRGKNLTGSILLK